MPDFRDLIPEADEQHPLWHGIIAEGALDFNMLVPVIIPDWDEHLMWGPCRWQSRDDTTLPAKGDVCLVLFSNRREPWVVAWWPF